MLTTIDNGASIRAQMTGMDLKLRRVRLRVKQRDLGPIMGVGRARIAQIEATHEVPQRTASRYLAALATFGDGATSGIQAA